MNPPDEQRLFELVTSFRDAIFRTERNKLPISLREFPLGSCGDASLLLAKFLNKHGFAVATYVCGHLGPYSHAWLELEGFLIDITADQFVQDPERLLWSGHPRDLRKGVIVTNDRSWHSRFGERFRNSADLSQYDDATQVELDRCYHEIAANL